MIASALIAIVLLAQSPPPQVSNGLAMARQLYAAGAYEEALVQLATVGPSEPADATDAASQMRALCLLALGRTDDARQALEALPVEAREVIVLRELEGLSYKEIGVIADIPLGTVMSRLARARKRLQHDLAKRWNGERT